MRPNRRWMAKQAKADSKWELKLHEGVLSECIFHGKDFEVAYEVPKIYKPDFIRVKDGQVLYIESKGRFRDSAEAAKYKYIRRQLAKLGHEFVFLFYNPKTAMPHAKKRKDGTKQTHGEWADRNGFQWFTEETIREIL